MFPQSMGCFFLKIFWPYACMKQHEASSPHPECYIFPVQHEQDSGLTEREMATKENFTMK